MDSFFISIISVLFTCTTVLSVYFMITFSYNTFISFFGYKNLKKDYELIEDETRFLILVAAHNEEAVISQTLDNLKAIDYDKSLFDICVVSDNSTDNTTAIAKDHEVIVIDTIKKKFPREGVGKPAGIQYALRELNFEHIRENYDLIMVLDADNFVDNSILREINSQYIAKNKPEAIQSYLDTKNYSKVSSLAYSIVFWTNNRFSQAAKYRLGLPNSIGGTGFFIRADWLINNGGFKFKSLTEDLEMEIEIVRDGGRILWNDFTGVYDEKPESTKISMIQRHRWVKGHWYVGIRSILPLTFKLLTTFNIKFLDKIFFLMTMGKALHTLLVFILLTIMGSIVVVSDGSFDLFTSSSLNSVWNIANEFFFYIYGFNILLIIYSMVFLPAYSVYKRKIYTNYLKVIVSMQWFIYTDLIVQLIGLFTWHRQGVWVATPHSKTDIETRTEMMESPGQMLENPNQLMDDMSQIQEDFKEATLQTLDSLHLTDDIKIPKL